MGCPPLTPPAKEKKSCPSLPPLGDIILKEKPSEAVGGAPKVCPSILLWEIPGKRTPLKSRRFWIPPLFFTFVSCKREHPCKQWFPQRGCPRHGPNCKPAPSVNRVFHSYTRTHVILLGPCYKTGRLKPCRLAGIIGTFTRRPIPFGFPLHHSIQKTDESPMEGIFKARLRASPFDRKSTEKSPNSRHSVPPISQTDGIDWIPLEKKPDLSSSL